ncbi:MAG: cyclic nucleotide-binding domain-containing protein [Blastochloris sp.]|nr:cyclic nucleotide-binding domain-containing protein [Blastochloris sp.]
MTVSFSEISRMTLFRGFDASFIQLLDLFFVENTYEAETTLVHQGSLQNTFYLIFAGEVEVFHHVDQVRVSLSTLAAGQFFGEINLFDPGLATANVITLTPVRTLEISNDKFSYFIQHKPELAADFTFQLAETIVKRFRNNNETLMQELGKPENILKAQQVDRGPVA